ncbi:unnamed protein product [Prunus armeniaca]
MAQAALKISLRKRFDGMLAAQRRITEEELFRRHILQTPSSSIHLVEVESEEDIEGSEEREIAVAGTAKLKHPISCKALTKPPKDQKLPPFTGRFVPNKPTQNKVYSFDLTKVDALFNEMLLHKAIETPHRDVIQEGITAGRLKLAEKPPTITTDPFPQPQVNMVNLNWLEQKIGKLAKEASTSRGGRVTREANQRPKATISAGVVLGIKCKPTLELTRTQKMRVQRQYCTFLKNKDDTQMEYDGELDEETEAFGAEGQENTLEGDMFSQESFEHRRVCFSKPTKELANHLRPLFIIANFGGIPIPKVMVDGGAAINLLPHKLLSKMGRTEKDLIPTRLIVTNFVGGITKTHGILHHVFTYNALLGRDWIHQSLCVPSTLHQQLAIWNKEGYMEIVEADARPFLPSAICFEARYYHDDLGPFTFLGVNQKGRPHGVTAQRLIEDGLASSLKDWNRPLVLNLQNSDV